ncbi:chromatin assembly factor 1 protein WD40 domain, putative [Plasmodium gallinaceum]|uniref:Chromatin assembly factor 1 protein WD40 domain, putative n=1 Tax=Plasmodium gallinaceum TaxID=5849 RepID=A0A1J1GLQ5_PLAGA|nr:chromatin assembly factor 1 protein WD40 domain, putative [Plasmodium gallinaceum]CRG93360.1 chromatin assembly factor 1 protein WD40 domain, putative [Plasmodium gallinaceum]
MSSPKDNKKRKSNTLDEACIELSEEVENEEVTKEKEESEEEDIEVQFNNWKTNSGLLYDFVCRKELEWPSLSIDFGDFHDENIENNVLNQIVCVGTHTSNKEPNFLYVCDVLFPLEKVPQEKCVYKENENYEGFEFCTEKKKFTIKSKIAHTGEVNRIKFLPMEKKNFVVTKAVDGNLHLFDINKHKIETNDDKMSPEVSFIGNQSDGFGLDFNTHKKNILTCGNDGLINVYDYNDLSSNIVNPFYKVQYKSPINDISPTNDPNLILACADNGYILLYDLRIKTSEPAQQVLGQQVPVNSVSLNKFTGYFASGSDNGKIKIWDIKKFNEPQHIINAHQEAIIRLNFSPNDSSLLASASNNRFINVYDLNKIGEELDAIDLSDGPSELIFSHGGHTQSITDFNWNHHKKLKMFIGSTSEDNTLQFWQLKMELLDETNTVPTTDTDVE